MCMNKCSKPGCDNLVSDNRHELCQSCHRKDVQAANYHMCETPGCGAMVLNRFRFCLKCNQAFKAEQQARMDASVKLRELNQKQEAEATFRMSLIKGLETSLSDSRVLTGLPTLETATLFPQDAKENRETLFSCMEEHLPEGVKIKCLKGAQVILAKGDQSYTVYCEALGDAFKKIDQAAADRRRQAEAKRQAEVAEAQRAEHERVRSLFLQYKKGELDIVHEERADVRITVLLADGRTVDFDDLDEIEMRAQRARDAKAAADAKIKAERRANEKKGGKQRKAA